MGDFGDSENARFERFGEIFKCGKKREMGDCQFGALRNDGPRMGRRRRKNATRVNFTKRTLALTGGSNFFVSTPFREKHIDRVEDENRRI